MRAHSAEGREPSASILSRCLVEGDAAAAARARRAQRKALVASLGVEAAVLAALVLVPLLAIGRLPEKYRVSPVPPYGVPRGNPQAQHNSTKKRASGDEAHPRSGITLPPRIPASISSSANNEAPPTPQVGPESGSEYPEGPLPPLGPVDPRRTPPMPPQAARPQSTRAVKRSEGVQQALLVRRVQPSYPILARQAGVEGTVRLHALIGRDGTIRELEVLSGHPLLVSAARDAVREWRYQPTLLNGEPVEVETYITVVFQLRR